MPLPDPHAHEPTVQLDRDKVKLWMEAKAAEKAWKREADRLRAEIERDMGYAYAGTVDGVKVIFYRPQDRFAEVALCNAYPDLTAHFMRSRTIEEFQMGDFLAAHPDIAEQYRVRAFQAAGE